MERIIVIFKENIILLAFVATLLVAFYFLRTEPASLVDESAFNSAIQAGRPTVVEFYSNF
ncbi:MAG: hypothetical protein JXA42_17865 [Anaerolineales bacterium]|nr:hypothetical protein [Anaerolineales bacterium]